MRHSFLLVALPAFASLVVGSAVPELVARQQGGGNGNGGGGGGGGGGGDPQSSLSMSLVPFFFARPQFCFPSS